MDEKRPESAPTYLMLLAACALGFSWYAALRLVPDSEAGPAAFRAKPKEEPRRPLRWPVDQLNELARVDLEDLGVEHFGSDFSVLRISPPAMHVGPGTTVYSLSGWPVRFFPPQSIGAGKDSDSPRMVVLLPAPARLSASKEAVRESDAWSVFGFDSLGMINGMGQVAAGWPTNRQRESASISRMPKPFDDSPVIREAKDEPRPQLSPPRLAASLISTVSPRSAALLSLPSIERYLSQGARGGIYPIPTQIGKQLSRLSNTPSTAGWAWAVAYRLRGVVGSGPADEIAVHRSLTSLRRASEDAAQLAEQTSEERVATELRRSHYALERRLATWSAVHRDQSAPSTQVLDAQRRDWLLGARWAMTPQGWEAWPGLAGSNESAPASIRLAKRLEHYEAAPTGSKAREIVVEASRLARAGDEVGLQLASAVQQHYRNANLRVAVAADLIERLLPETSPTTSVIRDRIAGAPVRGRSTTAAQLSVVPVPADDAWRIALRADGVVRSQTTSRGGPAVLKSQGATNFYAEKSIFIDNRGFWSHRASARATGSKATLTGVSTRYDNVPLFGSYARSTARREYERKKQLAGSEIRTKVERRVSHELDTRADTALTNLHRQYREEVVDRLGRLGLRAEPVEMRTTDKRIIGRLRIAGDQQLAAHTPRMMAPSDSLLSVQLHESTLNNAIEGLGLAGEKMSVEELRRRLALKLDITPNGTIDRESSRTLLRFAETDPIRVSFGDGFARLTLAIDEMSVRGKRHRGFKVHTLYRPSTEGLRASLVQEGTAQIEGRMRSSSRLRLHAAVGKVLGEDRRIPLTPSLDQLRPDMAERLQGLTTTQLVIEDGWLGIAVAPERPVGRVATRVGRYVR